MNCLLIQKCIQIDIYALQTDAPGPGSYVRHAGFDNQSVSFSKKGTGGFASKVISQLYHLYENFDKHTQD